MNFRKKKSLLMDLRLLVHQNHTSLHIPLTFLILLMSSATTISATNRLSNKINTDLIYRNDVLIELNQHNNNNDNNNLIYKSKNSPRILTSIIGTNTLVKNEEEQQQLNEQIINQKFSQPFNRNDTDHNDIGFRPIKPHGLDQNYVQNALFTADGHFRVFEDTHTQPTTTNIEIHKKIQKQQKEQQQQDKPFIPIINPIFKSEILEMKANVITTIKPIIVNESIKDRLVKRHIISKSEFSNEIFPYNQNHTTYSVQKNPLTQSNNLIKKSATVNEKPFQDHNYNKTNFNIFQEFLNSNVVQDLQKSLFNIIHNALSKDSYELLSGIRIETHNNLNDSINITEITKPNEINAEIEEGRSLMTTNTKRSHESFGEVIERELINFINRHYLSINVPRAAETGRLFFFKGIKKLLWPLFLGVQIAKSILLALFLPSILGSLGKMVGKGLVQVSGFNHQSEAVNDLDFKDNSFNMMNDDNKYNIDDYSYPRPEASENHFTAHLYEKATNNMNNALSRFGYGDNKKPHTTSPNTLFKDTDSKNSHSSSGSLGITSNKNSYKDFLKVPSSSLLLSNYDPFYSPLLSRIDSVFAQLGIAKKQDSCKEKLVCLMYAHPAKYAPYSNLVSAQLSRELNELRKPTSNNEEILRFFKYMKAAKDGQDGVDCEKTYELCKDYQDSDDPVMITTYNDINKLVQARKILRR